MFHWRKMIALSVSELTKNHLVVVWVEYVLKMEIVTEKLLHLRHFFWLNAYTSGGSWSWNSSLPGGRLNDACRLENALDSRSQLQFQNDEVWWIRLSGCASLCSLDCQSNKHRLKNLDRTSRHLSASKALAKRIIRPPWVTPELEMRPPSNYALPSGHFGQSIIVLYTLVVSQTYFEEIHVRYCHADTYKTCVKYKQFSCIP